MRRLLMTTVFVILPQVLWADDLALLIGNERYEQQDRVRGADDLLRARTGLQELGFDVRAQANVRADAATALVQGLAGDLSGAERLVVALSGHFVTDGERTWLLSAEASEIDLFNAARQGLSVESVMRVLAQRPGQAVLVLGQADPDGLALQGPYLRAGIGSVVAAQGVTLVVTDPGSATDLVEDTLTQPEADLAPILNRDRALDVSGYLPRSFVLMPGPVEVDVAPPESVIDLNAEARDWDAAVAADTVAAYRAYIRRYPTGRFVGVAEETIAEILAEPNRAARLSEEALSLTRTARRSIQSDLTVLGYDTRGVDGIFGSGSRRAITNWQQSNGYPQTGYVTQAQINQLNAQAERRRSDIEAEEARARAEQERLDRAYWAETGARGDEAGYRIYLDRYPDGVFAALAKERLDEIEAVQARDAEVADRAAWAEAATAHTVAAYQAYLTAWPEGVFASEARDRLAALSEPDVPDATVEAARRQEQALQLNGIRAQLLELRLRDLGFAPGPLDGVVDERTRNALRQYQEAQGITPTGYVDQTTLLGLMGARAPR